MDLYHGSLEIIKNPKILKPTRTLDYGPGFYTTTSSEQAEKWVLRKLQNSSMWGYVNHYTADFNGIMRKLKTLIFDKPDEKWLDFVMANRTDAGFVHDYDVVYGPVANDRVYAAFSLYESGLFNKEDLIRELRAYKLVDQMLFHTELSLSHITFVKARPIKL